MKTIFFAALCSSLPAFAGPSISTGSDGCIAAPYAYECVVKTDPEGTFEETYRFDNRDQAESKGTARVEIGMCGNGSSLSVWLTLHSRKYAGVDATSQIEVPLRQRKFELLVNLAEGDNGGVASYYFATCEKIR